MRLTKSRCPASSSAAIAGSTILRQTEVFERVAGSATRFSTHGVRSTQACSAAKLASARARVAARPPIASIQSSASIASATPSIEGVLIVSPAKMPSISLPPLVRRKIFGSGRGGRVALQPLDGARAEDQHAVAALAAHRLLPGEGGDVELVPGQVLSEGGRGGVAEGQARRGRRRSSRRRGRGRREVVPFQVKQTSASGPHRREVGQRAVGRGQHPAVGELQLLGRVGRPALAEALPDQHVDGPGAEHRPHRHLEGAGVGGGHDADAVVGRHAEQARGAVDHVLQLRLRLRGAVRAAEEGAGGDRLGGPARALGAGARGELGTRRVGWRVSRVPRRPRRRGTGASAILRRQGDVPECAPLALIGDAPAARIGDFRPSVKRERRAGRHRRRRNASARRTLTGSTGEQ